METFKRNVKTITIQKIYDNYQENKYYFDTFKQKHQRTWSEAKKSFFLDSIFKNYPIPIIYLRPRIDMNTDTIVYDIVDGEQRLKTIIDFIENKIPLTEHFGDFQDDIVAKAISGKTIEEIKKEHVTLGLYQFFQYPITMEFWYESDIHVIKAFNQLKNHNNDSSLLCVKP